MNRPPLAVIVPAFNEARRLTDNLFALLSYLQDYRPAAELIVLTTARLTAARGAEEFSPRIPTSPAGLARRDRAKARRARRMLADQPDREFSDGDTRADCRVCQKS